LYGSLFEPKRSQEVREVDLWDGLQTERKKKAQEKTGETRGSTIKNNRNMKEPGIEVWIIKEKGKDSHLARNKKEKGGTTKRAPGPNNCEGEFGLAKRKSRKSFV